MRNQIKGKHRGFDYSPLAGLIIFAFSHHANAALHFDPAMIAGENYSVADLSVFENGGSQLPGIYEVNITLNGKNQGPRSLHFYRQDVKSPTNSTEQPLIHDDTGLMACLSVKDLKNMGVNLSAFPVLASLTETECIAPERYIPQARTFFDFQKMQLDISIPQAAMVNRPEGWISPELWDDGINAALASWQFSGSENHSAYGHSRSQFLNLTSGVNLGAWRLRDTSTWANTESPHSQQQHWQHLNTLIQRAIIPWRSELTFGDSATDSDIFEPLSFRGIQLATDDNMYPDTLKGFAPVIRGMADSNAQVSIRQNGNVIYRTFVSPGAFEINDLYPVSTGGDLEVSIKEADGRIHRFAVPYSSVPVLQREGHLRYAFIAGRYRGTGKGYDNPAFIQGTLLWGLTSNITVYGGTQLADNYRALALGAGTNMGNWGALSADITQADSLLIDGSRHEGQSLRFLYGRSLVSTGTTLQLAGYRFSTQGFHTLDETALKRMQGWSTDPAWRDETGHQVMPDWNNYYNLYDNKRDRLQVSISQRLGALGSMYLTGNRQTYWDKTASTASLQAGFSSTFGRVNYNISYGYSQYSGQPHSDRTLYLSMSLPLSLWLSEGFRDKHPTWVSYGMSRDSRGHMAHQASMSGTTLDRNNLNWNVSQGLGQREGHNGDASLSYQGTYGNASAGYGYSDNYRQIRYGVSGSAVIHNGGLTMGQPLGTTNILVSVPGAADIPVENGQGISTDWRGYTIVPYASMYRENRIALDIDHLDERTEVDNAVTRVVPTRGAFVKADFRVRKGIRALLTLKLNGKPVPFGSIVSGDHDDNSSLVGAQGQVYLSGLEAQGELRVVWGREANQHCSVYYKFPDSQLDQSVSRTSAECR
ncbi:MAG: fimbrial biogenesis usher protein [Kluyvera sp.]|uniref:fimbrial biogenesis usher protein n=1 Tax=Kluyvera sp. TaxID=1538228 RepID=UPI003F3F0430